MKQKVKLTFPQHLTNKPVLFTMAKEYDVMPNISRARTTETFGEIFLELEGKAENVNKGLQSLKDMGISVELIDEDVS